MDIVKFKLSGPFAFFKNPEVNTFCYFTFNNIHKVALMGILGSILGLNGYNQQGLKDEYPEFYDKLKDLKIAIVPNGSVCLEKKIHEFNNTTMFANKGANKYGATLIVKEQWLENPSWDVYIKLDKENELHKELEERLLKRRFKYIPYLGKNDHFANITDVEVFDLEDIKNISDEEIRLDSFFLKEEFEDRELDPLVGGQTVRYQEFLPYGLEEKTNHYMYKPVAYSSGTVKSINQKDVFKIGDRNIAFM